MPVLAIPMFWGAVAAGTGAAATVYGANKQSDATQNALKSQIDANARQQDYLKSQQEQDQRNFELTQKTNQANFERTQQANYGQWAQRQRNAGPFIGAGTESNNALSDALGLPRNAGPRVPSYNESFGGGSGGGPAANIDPTKGDIAGQVSAYFKSRGVADTETPYWAEKWNEFGAKDPAYFNKRLSDADIFRGNA